jgi:hypothetical protein
MNMIEKACEELTGSIRFRKLLGIVLSLGNKLNTAGSKAKGKVGSFTIQSLLKLHQTKAFDNKTTFLQYVILVVERNDGDLSGFKDDLPSVIKAEKIFWDQCMSDLDEVENQLHNVRKMALLEVKMKKRAPWAKVKKEEDENLSDSSLTLEEEVVALRSTKIGVFALDAMKKVSSLMSKVEATKTTFGKLLEYFGEEENKGLQPHSLFEIIVSFMKNYDAARKELFRQGKLKVRSRLFISLGTSFFLNHSPPLAQKKVDPQPATEQKSNIQRPQNYGHIKKDVKKANSPPLPLHAERENSRGTRDIDHAPSPSVSTNQTNTSGPNTREPMSESMNNAKIRHSDNDKQTSSPTVERDGIKNSIATQSPHTLPTQSAKVSIVDSVTNQTKISSNSPGPHPEIMAPSLTSPISSPANNIIQSTTSRVPSPTLPPSYNIPENKPSELPKLSPQIRMNIDDIKEMPADQKHAVQVSNTMKKPSNIPASDRDSVSNAQTTLRARRERLARRKLITR